MIADSVNDYEKRLRDFINDQQRRTLMLKGGWGVGKTWFWRNFAKKQSQADYSAWWHVKKLLRKRAGTSDRPFGYVSLFGLSSLEELRSKVICSLGGSRWIHLIADELRNVVADQIKLNVPSLALTWLENKLVNGAVVCLDDIERKRREFSLESVFGFVDHLRTECDCHCILIVNDGELAEEENVLKKYRDKIVDVEIQFSPTLDHNIDIAFVDFRDAEIKAEVRSVLLRMETLNIRTIQRIRWMIQDLEPLTHNLPSALRLQIVRQIATLCIFQYEHGEVFVPARIIGAHWLAMKVNENLEEKNNEEKSPEYSDQMAELMYKAKFIGHELDLVLLDYLQSGFFDFAKHQESIDAWKVNMVRHDVANEIGGLQNAAWGSYAVKQGELLDQMTKFLDRRLSVLTFDEYNSTVKFAVELDPNFPREQWDGRYFEVNIDRIKFEQIPQFEHFKLSPADRQTLKEKGKVLLRSHSMRDVIARICSGGGWSPSDYRFLNAFSEREFYEYAIARENENVVHEFSVLAERLRGETSKFHKEVANKLRTVVTDLSRRSVLDARRSQKTLKRLEALASIAETVENFDQ